MPSLRNQRANSEVQRALSEILLYKLNDPRLQNFITVTYANVSPDFRYCKVGISAYNCDLEQIMKLLKNSEGYIKKELISMVKLPYTPKLVFVKDLGAENSECINAILDNLNIPKEENNNDETNN